MIPIEQLEEMFAGLREQTDWDVDGELRWGYFFFDPDPVKLERLGETLVADGYDLVRLEQTDDETSFVLHVERIEAHTPQSLDARNREFERLAEQHGVADYDGMDVGPVTDDDE
jgi:hypothetical protein